MDSASGAIGVVVLEPNKQLLDKLCGFSASVWGVHEVLPRQTARELKNAADNLKIGLVVVRASFQRSSLLIQSTLADLYASGTQIVVLQDTAFKLKEKGWATFEGLHFLSDQAGDEQLRGLLTLTLVRHCVPGLDRSI